MLLFVNAAVNPYVTLAVARPKLAILVPLLITCLAIVVAISVAAARGKLHMVGYMGVAFASFAIAMIAGKLSGVRWISGTVGGLLLSLLFFFAIAATLGSLAAIIFYKPPQDPAN